MNALPPDPDAGLYDSEPVEALANILARTTLPLLEKIASYAEICTRYIDIEDVDGLVDAGAKLLKEVRSFHITLKEIRASIDVVRFGVEK